VKAQEVHKAYKKNHLPMQELWWYTLHQVMQKVDEGACMVLGAKWKRTKKPTPKGMTLLM